MITRLLIVLPFCNLQNNSAFSRVS
jgi:hypothetical protein